MASDLKRLTISVTQDIETDLETAKKEHFGKISQNEMILALIAKGLDSFGTDVEDRRGVS